MKVEISETPARTIEILRGDITTQKTDAIINAANAGLRGGGGVDGAIHRVGGPEIMQECRRLGGCATGSACLTTAGLLNARYVIHAVGPVWRGGDSGERELLAGAYRRTLDLARDQSLASLSFPSISTGAYRFPLTEAAPIALAMVKAHLEGETSIERVAFVLFNEETFEAYGKALASI